MQTKIRFKLSSDWSQVIEEVSKQCGMSVDEYCHRATILFTKQGLQKSQKEQSNGQGFMQPEGAGSQSRPQSSAGSDVLADPENTKLHNPIEP